MRKDIARVIITPGRYNSHAGRVFSRCKIRCIKKERAFTFDDGEIEYEGRYGTRAKTRVYGWAVEKSFSDMLSPLYRFIEKNIGRKWDDVYSEFCAVTKANNTRSWHARLHFKTMVDFATKGRDGKVYVTTSYGGVVPLERLPSWSQVYVDLEGVLRSRYYDPESVLRRKSFKYRKPSFTALTGIKVVEERFYLKVNENWFEVTLAATSDKTKAPRYDAVNKVYFDACGVRIDPAALHKAYHRHDLYAWKRRSLSKKEIKKLGLIE